MEEIEKFRILLEESYNNKLRREMIREFYRYYIFLDPPEIDN